MPKIPSCLPVCIGAGGTLRVEHRPGARLIPELAADGFTHVVTLLAEREGVRVVEGLVRETAMAWVWLPLENARPPEDAVGRERFVPSAHVVQGRSTEALPAVET